jgi:DNA polymerase-3 subunit epsilon
MKFSALDVETANADLSSICQVGIVVFEEGQLPASWVSLVNPEAPFSPTNTFIHGITESMVQDAPKFPQIFGQVSELLSNQIVVSHTHFDRVAFDRVITKYTLPEIACRWLDSARVTRRAWPQFSRCGYGLADISEFLGIEFQHHAAHEDARAAGEVVLRAILETGIDLESWLGRAMSRTQSRSGGGSEYKIALDGNPEGPLFGEVIVFTGSLTMVRSEAAAMAAEAGCTVEVGVTKKTTLLVVGDQDIYKLAGHEKSQKHRKSEELIQKGQQIRILSEGDFTRMLGE